MELKEMQLEAFQNKVRRGWNTTRIDKEIITLVEELGELARVYRDSNHKPAAEISNKEAIANAIGDLMVYCLGLCQMMNINSKDLLEEIIQENRTREHRSHI